MAIDLTALGYGVLIGLALGLGVFVLRDVWRSAVEREAARIVERAKEKALQRTQGSGLVRK